ncbi:MAG: polyprenyl synthetase family protein [candidate division WOR-3 bacterium]
MKEFDNYKNLVEQELRRIFQKKLQKITPRTLYSAMTYSVLSPGKRLRPILCLMSYKATCKKLQRKIKYSEILPFACGLEFIHTFSLIQDDLPAMDNDDFRRGKPTLHRKYNEAIALLAADALFAYAFELFFTAPVHNDIKINTALVLAETCGPQGLAGGQLLDILNKKNETLSYYSLEQINKKKTASLISSSIKIGAIVANAPAKIIATLEEAGVALGLLFQLTDDIIDKKISPNGKTDRMLQSYAKAASCNFEKLGQHFENFKELIEILSTRTA